MSLTGGCKPLMLPLRLLPLRLVLLDARNDAAGQTAHFPTLLTLSE